MFEIKDAKGKVEPVQLYLEQAGGSVYVRIANQGRNHGLTLLIFESDGTIVRAAVHEQEGLELDSKCRIVERDATRIWS